MKIPKHCDKPPGSHEKFDVMGGMAIAAVGVASAFIAHGYAFGTLRRMGPGYLPTVLSVLLIVVGIIVAIQRSDRDEEAASLAIRPLIAVLGSILAFAVLVRPLGLVIATLVTVPVAAIAEPKARPLPTAVLAVGMAVAISLIFVWFLNVPISLGWW